MLTAPIHCRTFIAEQMMEWYCIYLQSDEETNSSVICVLDGSVGYACLEHFHFWVNYTFKKMFKVFSN